MTDSIAIAIAASTQVPLARRVARPGFFVWMAGLMLVMVLIGFSPTFYLRSYVASPSFPLAQIPAYLYVHGWVLTLWFVLLLMQTLLIGSGRVTWHRRLGWFAAADAAAVVGVSAFVNVHAIAQALIHPGPQGFPQLPFPQPSEAALVAQASGGLVSNAALLVNFAVPVVAAIVLRHRPAEHKRLMLCGSIPVLSAATSRFGFVLMIFGVPGDRALPIGGIVGAVVTLLLLTAVIVHDKVTLRRVLPVTWWCVGFAVILPFVARWISTTSVALEWTSQLIYGGR